VILRGSTKGPNYAAEHVLATGQKLSKAGLNPRVMIDCSHGNSSKQHVKQIEVGNDIASQLASNEANANMIMGVMIESNINEGNQKIPVEGPAALKYGVSITDACISLEQTVPVLDALRAGIRARRQNNRNKHSSA
jgi:3-deoxy-7-phosphoheptulonate synthase